MRKHNLLPFRFSKTWIFVLAVPVIFFLVYSKNSVMPSRTQRRLQQETPNSMAIVHVGPLKMASTTLQRAITYDSNTFLQDNYSVKAPFHELALCLEQRGFHCDSSEQFFAEVARNRQNVLISSEVLDRPMVQVPLLASYLQPWDHTKIVLVYRRFYEWLPSVYNQMHKVNMPKWEQYRSLVQWLSAEEIQNWYDTKYTTGVFKRYNEVFDDVVVFNMHDSDDIIRDFYCDVLQAQYVCRKRKLIRWQNFAKNEGHTLEYDRLVREAYEKKLLDVDPSMEMEVVKERVQEQNEIVWNRSTEDLRKECLSQEVLNLILNLSLEAERQLFPETYKIGERVIREGFEDAKEKGMFCNGNVEEILKEDEWKEFFQQFDLQ